MLGHYRGKLHKILSRHLILIRIYMTKVIQSWLRPNLGLKLFSSNILSFFDTHDSSGVKEFWLNKKFSLLRDHMKINSDHYRLTKSLQQSNLKKRTSIEAIEMSSRCNQNYHFLLHLTITELQSSLTTAFLKAVCSLLSLALPNFSHVPNRRPPAY